MVFFSSIGENTTHFVEKLPYESVRVPVKLTEPELFVDREYVLITPTYGAGRDTGAVPKQVVKFLRHREHRDLCKAIVGTGNRNFGEHFLLAPRMLSETMGKPVLYGAEVSGTSLEVKETIRRIDAFWPDRNQDSPRSSNEN